MVEAQLAKHLLKSYYKPSFVPNALVRTEDKVQIDYELAFLPCLQRTFCTDMLHELPLYMYSVSDLGFTNQLPNTFYVSSLVIGIRDAI